MHGPYRFLRHPGYSAAIVQVLTNGLALGSWWSVVPMTAFAALLIRRTAWEDRFLQEHMEGYRAYAGRVRWRLLPGVW
jgi:protein-S-isoprenylcysteine O-methyltransferase Ste14